jgi:hypothetical protein
MIIILLFLGIVCALLIVAAFAGKRFKVQRECAIDATPQEVYDHIRFLEHHQAFSKWTTKDPAKRTPMRGTDGTVGCVLPWHNYAERAGVGELEITDLIPGRQVEVLHRYFKPVTGIGTSTFTIAPVPMAGSVIRWTYTGMSKYPINLITATMNMDKIIGPALADGLSQLAKVMTDKPFH